MTTSEEVIEEIRESRCRLSRRFGHDPAKYIAYLRTFEHKYAAQIERYRKEHGARPAEPGCGDATGR